MVPGKNHGLEGRIYPLKIIEHLDPSFSLAKLPTGKEVIVKNSGGL